MSRRYRFDDIEVDVQNFRLLKAGRPIAIEPKALNLLIFLVENPDRLVSRRELIDVVWDGAFVTDHVLNRAIGQLRRQLADDPKEPRYVETVPTLGYRFIATIEAEVTEAEPSLSDVNGNSRPPHSENSAVQSATLAPQTPPVQTPAVTRSRAWIVIAAGIAVALGILTFWTVRRHAISAGARPIQSLAVLPLQNLSGDPGQEYFADSVTDELTAMLAKGSTLRVISHTSAMQFKEIHRQLPEVARELGVDGILEGSIARSGDTVHLTIQLIQAPTDTHLWAESYDRRMNDIATLPSEIARSIAKRLNSSVPPLPSARYVSPEAHDAYVHGRYLWTCGDLEKAFGYFKKATELQPDYALAWTGLADYYGAGVASGQLDPRQALSQQEAAATKALQLDDSLAQAHLSMAAAYLISRWDWAGADREVLRAIELDPKLADAYYVRADLLSALNRYPEAIELEKKALEIDPFSRPYALADLYIGERDYDAALKDAFQRLESTNNIGLHFSVATAYWNKGMYKEAVQYEEKAYVLDDDKESAAGIRRAFQEGGPKGVTLWRLSTLTKSSAKHYVSPVALARVYAELGERDKTLSLLEEGYRRRDTNLLGIQSDPPYDFLHTDERYRSIIRNVGLPPTCYATR